MTPKPKPPRPIVSCKCGASWHSGEKEPIHCTTIGFALMIALSFVVGFVLCCLAMAYRHN